MELSKGYTHYSSWDRRELGEYIFILRKALMSKILESKRALKKGRISNGKKH